MTDDRRLRGVRLPRIPRRLPQLPAAPPDDRRIIIQTVPPPPTGSATVPPTFRAASEWVWRSLVIGTGILALLWVASKLTDVVFPVIVALLLAALLEPAFQHLRYVLPRGAAAGVTVLGTLAGLIALFSFVGNQFADQLPDMTRQVTQGIDESRRWIVDTFGLTEGQITTWLSDQWGKVSAGDQWSSRAAQAGLTIGQMLTGFFLAMFSLFFFLYDGAGIWAWVVRLFPRGARTKVLSSGAIAWNQLKAFTRATVLVAGTDALGIGLGALVLGVPFASGVALLVFVGSFIPIVGALLSGFVAVALAFVAKGPITALIMLGVVIAVQQLESHVLQPLLLGRAVRVHPLGVILAIATGIIVGGIIGALVAVPLAAVLNAVGHNLLEPVPDDVDHPDDLTTPAQEAEIDEDIAEADERSRLEPGDSPFDV
ncbi:AI-2E family transporter [Janibacter terrae]|uniref:AI-2E family transporter n=1 Tax=Janibacter terrae TaxID=103817 RepID=UPI00083937A6|nr:AI-2E family transporter [Janibacter terrae]MBA4084885.1 AI-2E family transporter [Kytococcus sp.]HBO53725.1 AI-2E family transporter [Janibacter terrae]HCE59947.1 AI-2E family transporter [Janibacter terrae]